MNTQNKELNDSISCEEQSSRNQERKRSETDLWQNLDFTRVRTMQTGFWMLRLEKATLQRKLKEVKNLYKRISKDLKTKTQLLSSSNARILILESLLKQKEDLVDVLNEKNNTLQEMVASAQPHSIHNYQNGQYVNENKEDIFSDYSPQESAAELYRLHETVKELQATNYQIQQSLAKELERSNLMEKKMLKVDKVIKELSAENSKLQEECQWGKTRCEVLLKKEEALTRKNSSLQTYSNYLRDEYESLLQQRKKNKNNKEKEIIQSDTDNKMKSNQNVESEGSGVNIIDPILMQKTNSELERNKSSEGELEKEHNNENEKVTLLEEKLESMNIEINILQDEKKDLENRLKKITENHNKLRIRFDELTIAHRNLLDFKIEKGLKTNETIVRLTKRLGFLGKQMVKRLEDDSVLKVETTEPNNIEDGQPSLKSSSENVAVDVHNQAVENNSDAELFPISEEIEETVSDDINKKREDKENDPTKIGTIKNGIKAMIDVKRKRDLQKRAPPHWK